MLRIPRSRFGLGCNPAACIICLSRHRRPRAGRQLLSEGEGSGGPCHNGTGAHRSITCLSPHEEYDRFFLCEPRPQAGSGSARALRSLPASLAVPLRLAEIVGK